MISRIWAWFASRGIVICLLIFISSTSWAEAPNGSGSANARTDGKEHKPQLITMNFKDVDLGILIKFISEITGKNFVVDPSVQGKVTILSPEKVTVDEAYQVFLSVLEVNGFTTVQAGKVIKIIKAAEAKGKGVETRFKKAPERPEDKIITQLYPLTFADSTELAKLLKPLVPRTGLLIPYAETNTLIIIDMVSNIDRLINIINELDVPGREQITILPLEYARAEKLAGELEKIFHERKGKRVGRKFLKIIPDERTNTLVILSNPKITAQVKTLVAALDKKQSRPRTNIHIYTLENATAEDMVKVLSEIPKKGGKPLKGKAPLLSQEVKITADKATNSLVIVADPDEYRIIEKVIKKLDVARTMVYVEALIIEVSAEKALELGVEWRVGNEYNGGYGEGKKGGVWAVGTAATGNDSTVQRFSAGALPGGFSAGVIGKAITLGGVVFPSIGAFVRAVRNDTDFNVISTPQILTLDNEEATIEVGQTIPFVTRVDQGTAVTDRAIQSFEYKDVGVTLKVTPQINNKRFVRLQIEETVRTVIQSTALGGTVLAPTTAFRSAKTTITVKDGETAVIGGLIENRIARTKAQTPCIGNIPIFGWLFKQVSDTDRKTNLLVFLTPHIIETPLEEKALYEKKKVYIDNEVKKATETEDTEKIRKKLFE